MGVGADWPELEDLGLGLGLSVLTYPYAVLYLQV